MYITPAQLVAGAGVLRELSQIFELADPQLLTLTIEGADRSAYTLEQIEAADAALTEINSAITQASSEMDGFLVQRGYPLPLSADQFPVLRTWARNIVRYHLQPQRDGTQEETGRVERDYRSTLTDLRALAKGERSLGATDPLIAQAAQDAANVMFSGDARVFSRNAWQRL